MAGATCSATSGTPGCRARWTPARSPSVRTSARRPARSSSATRSSRSSSTPRPRRRCGAVPLLVVWSVINRYYILDLAKDRSFIEYALGQGMQVFVTSWRNPSREHADWNLDTYAQALLDAMDAVREITGSEQIGTVGLCAGGQLLAATMAHLQGAGDDRVAYAGVRGQPDRHVGPERRRPRAAPRAARRGPARPPRPPASSTAGRSRPCSRGCGPTSWSGTSGSTTT